jgi:phosphoglycerate dehydrogenase-like enzyme
LGGAILDVFDPEPLPTASTLWTAPNVVITPHVSGDDATSYIEITLELLFDNLDRLLSGRPLRNIVQRELGY